MFPRRPSRRVRTSRADATKELFAALEQSTPPEDLILPLLEAFPRAARAKDAFDNYPLHTACSHGASLKIVKALVKAYPGAIKTVGSEEDYPLHLACIVGSSPLELIVYLGDQSRSAFSAPNRRQSRPLHLVCARNPTSALIRYMLEKGGSATKTKDHNRDLPLHVACKHGASVDILTRLVRKYPDALAVANSRGDWPLHAAVGSGASLSVLQWLWEKHPVGLHVGNLQGDLPLHLACTHDATRRKITALLRASPTALKTGNDLGDLPLHKALAAKASYEVILVLVENSRQSLAIPNKEGLLPLHVACQHQVDLPILIFLMDEWPQAVSTTTKDGSTPLHFCCRHRNITQDVITLLVSNWTGTLNTADGNRASTAAVWDHQGVSLANKAGDTPLHLACHYQVSRSVVKYLMGIWPEGVTTFNKNGKTPIERARRPQRGSPPSRATVSLLNKRFCAALLHLLEDADPSILKIRQLVRAHPDALRIADENGLVPLHKAVSCRHPALAIVKEVLGSWPEATHRVTSDGNTALHLACRAMASHSPLSSAHLELRTIVKCLTVFGDGGTSRIPNSSNELPLHVACQDPFPCLEVIQTLVKAWPESLPVRDSSGKTALTYAEATQDDQVVKWLHKRLYAQEQRARPASLDNSTRQSSYGSSSQTGSSTRRLRRASSRSQSIGPSRRARSRSRSRGVSPSPSVRSFRGNSASLSLSARRLNSSSSSLLGEQ
jgi:ankyrin repeat protein